MSKKRANNQWSRNRIKLENESEKWNITENDVNKVPGKKKSINSKKDQRRWKKNMNVSEQVMYRVEKRQSFDAVQWSCSTKVKDDSRWPLSWTKPFTLSLRADTHADMYVYGTESYRGWFSSGSCTAITRSHACYLHLRQVQWTNRPSFSLSSLRSFIISCVFYYGGG